MKITYLIMLLLCSSTKPIEKLQKDIKDINRMLNDSQYEKSFSALKTKKQKLEDSLQAMERNIIKKVNEKKTMPQNEKKTMHQKELSEKTEPIAVPIVKKEKIKNLAIPINQITDVKKIIALNKGTVFILCQKKNNFLIKKLNENNWINFNIPQTETNIFKDIHPIINDIAVYNDTLAIATFYKQERKSLLRKSEDTEAVIYVYDFNNNQNSVHRIQDAHKTAIKALFMDDNFVVSQSEAGNIRFFDLNNIKSPNRISDDIATDAKLVDPKAEYKAKNTLLYHNKCVIVEEATVIFGNELYVKYINEIADIITQNKIGTYKKEDSCPYIGAINNQGNAVLYDQRSRSIIHTENKESAIKETIFKRTDLPEELAFKVAKQIYYVENNILLIYEDEVVSIDIYPDKRPFKKRIVHYELVQKKGSKSVIHTTCLNNNMLYVVIKQKNNDSEEISFTMEDCTLKIKKE